MHFALVIAWLLLSIPLSVLPGHAQGRVALVIGNSAYRNVAALPNPQNDATDIAASFRRLGFSVTALHNGTFDDMRRALLQFGRDARGADMAVVFFAGHGMEIGGENWLIPVDAELRADQDAENEAISLKSVMTQVANAPSLGLVILDSCRDNPFAAQMQRVSRTRAVDRGLARIEPTNNVLVAYAAKDGTVAGDGRGRNSPFTTALLNNLEKAGVEIRFLLANVRDEVLAATNRLQQPFVYGSLSRREIYLKPPGSSAGTAALAQSLPQPLPEAERAWQEAKTSSSITVMEAFIRRYGGSFYADLARARIEELKKGQVATPPTSTFPALAPTVAPARPPAPASVAVVAPPVVPAAPQSPDPCAGPVTVSSSSRCAAPLTAGQERALKPKDSFKECAQCPEMVVVPAGSFTMGSPESEKERYKDEGPQHRVTFDRQFAAGKFSVTFEEWDACVADGGCNGYRPPDEWGHGRQPVIWVSWDNAKAYVAWLSRKTGKAYRLLSEAEREYLTRAGTTTPFWWGSSISTRQANYNGHYTYGGGGAEGESRQRTVAVDSFQPNPWSLYQVHGNVWEWTEDCYHENYNGAPTEGSAWTAGDCSRRVVRGGAWNLDPWYLRAANRGREPADYWSSRIGFRVGRTLTP